MRKDAGYMRAVHDLEHLRPVVREVPVAPQHPEVNEGRESPPGAGGGPAKAEGHELDDRRLARGVKGEVHLDRGREEGHLLPLLRVRHLAEDRPQASESCHVGGIDPTAPLPSACT